LSEKRGKRGWLGVAAAIGMLGLCYAAFEFGRASAGCLVGRTRAGHRAFMALCRSDPRYTANNSYRFLTCVLPAAEIATA